MNKRTKKGFTLVELVIVIAVIAILSAILIPTFGSIIKDANETKAKADLKAAITSWLAEKANDETVDIDQVNSAFFAQSETLGSSTKAAYVYVNGEIFKLDTIPESVDSGPESVTYGKEGGKTTITYNNLDTGTLVASGWYMFPYTVSPAGETETP